MRIPSGSTDQYVPFVAVDATDRVTYETGLSSFTVYRSRDGAAEVAMTTPTVVEVDATNMPGAYWLLLDEDTTVGSTHDEETMLLRITHAGMAPVTLAVELFRPKITAARVLGVNASGYVERTVLTDTVTTYTGNTPQTGDSFARIGLNGAGLTAVPWNASWDAEVQSEVEDALRVLHLHRFFESAYDPASKPGNASGLMNVLVENDGGVPRFTANALELAPAGGGGGGGTDWTVDERTAIRTILGVPASGATPETPASGVLASIKTAADAVLADTGTDGVVVAGASKTGYSLASTGLDSVAITAPTGAATTFPGMLVQLWRRSFKRSALTGTSAGAGLLRTYADDGTTVLTTQAVSDDGTSQIIGPAS